MTDSTRPVASFERFFASANLAFLDADRERALARAVARGCARSRDELVRSHMRLVWRIAREHRHHGVELEDLVSEGSMGLTVAASRFDPDRGVRFAAYATFWVRGYIRRYTLDNRRMVRLPSTRAARKILAHVRAAVRRLTRESGAPPTNTELAAALEVSEEELVPVTSRLGGRDAAIDDEEFMPIDDANPESTVADAELAAVRAQELTTALAALTERERRIVDRRILADEPTSLAVVGAELGVSRERVRQLESRALARLRAALDMAHAA